jgi:hypothetical protein
MTAVKVKARISTLHFWLQRGVTFLLAMGAGFYSLMMLVPLGADYSYDSPEPGRWILRSLGCLVIAFVAALLYWRIMKSRYPDYPHHKKDDGYPPIY